MIPIRRGIRKVARKFGVEVTRFDPARSVALRRVSMLRESGVDVVLDVGANGGQYGTVLRESGYRGRIESFEPLDGPFSELSARASGDAAWRVHQSALGDDDGEVVINVTANEGQSSSVLPMKQLHVDAAPAALVIGTQQASVRRLDSIAADVAPEGCTPFLKIDVQGFERNVLDGAKGTLDRIVGLELELSLAELYEGGMLIHEALDFCRQAGFTLVSIDPHFVDRSSGRLLQCDGIFLR